MHKPKRVTMDSLYHQMLHDFNLEVHNKVLQSAQMCWWYVLYAPDGYDWSKEKMLEYNKKVHEFEDSFTNLEVQERKKAEFQEDTGIDLEALAKKVSYQTRIKMYGKKIPFEFTKIAAYQSRSAIEDALFLAGYVLYHNFGLSAQEIEDINADVQMWMDEYKFGMNDDIWLQYFNGVGELPVIQ